jgi:hypothetical protein
MATDVLKGLSLSANEVTFCIWRARHKDKTTKHSASPKFYIGPRITWILLKGLSSVLKTWKLILGMLGVDTDLGLSCLQRKWNKIGV